MQTGRLFPILTLIVIGTQFQQLMKFSTQCTTHTWQQQYFIKNIFKIAIINIQLGLKRQNFDRMFMHVVTL